MRPQVRLLQQLLQTLGLFSKSRCAVQTGNAFSIKGLGLPTALLPRKCFVLKQDSRASRVNSANLTPPCAELTGNSPVGPWIWRCDAHGQRTSMAGSRGSSFPGSETATFSRRPHVAEGVSPSSSSKA